LIACVAAAIGVTGDAIDRAEAEANAGVDKYHY
jgi:hypothetical protein